MVWERAILDPHHTGKHSGTILNRSKSDQKSVVVPIIVKFIEFKSAVTMNLEPKTNPKRSKNKYVIFFCCSQRYWCSRAWIVECSQQELHRYYEILNFEIKFECINNLKKGSYWKVLDTVIFEKKNLK